MRSFLLAAAVLLCAPSSRAAEPARPAPAAQAPAGAKASAARCEHGVKKSLCTRCNPRLAPAFKAKGDWCAEHDRPESQCVLCNPALAKEGVK